MCNIGSREYRSRSNCRRCSVKKVFLKIRIIHRISRVPELRFYEICRKRKLRHSCFPANFANFSRKPFYRTPPGDCLCRSWREFVREMSLTLLLMTNFKECYNNYIIIYIYNKQIEKKELHAFFYNRHFYKQYQAPTDKNLSKS